MRPFVPSEFFAAGRSMAVLCGAGISRDSPANLPDGQISMRNVLLRAKPFEISDEWVLAGMNRPSDGISRPGEFLRFEAAMKALQDSGLDRELTVLDCFSAPGEPNFNQYVLADLVAAKHVVLHERIRRSTWGEQSFWRRFSLMNSWKPVLNFGDLPQRI